MKKTCPRCHVRMDWPDPSRLVCVNCESESEMKCNHNRMVATSDPKHAWKCAECGCIFGRAKAAQR